MTNSNNSAISMRLNLPIIAGGHIFEGLILALLASVGAIFFQFIMYPTKLYDPEFPWVIISLPVGMATSILAYGLISSRSLIALHISLLICSLIFSNSAATLVDRIPYIETSHWKIELLNTLKSFVLDIKPSPGFMVLTYIPALGALFFLSLIRSLFGDTETIAAQWSPYKIHIALLSIPLLIFTLLFLNSDNHTEIDSEAPQKYGKQ